MRLTEQFDDSYSVIELYLPKQKNQEFKKKKYNKI